MLAIWHPVCLNGECTQALTKEAEEDDLRRAKRHPTFQTLRNFYRAREIQADTQQEVVFVPNQRSGRGDKSALSNQGVRKRIKNAKKQQDIDGIYYKGHTGRYDRSELYFRQCRAAGIPRVLYIKNKRDNGTVDWLLAE